jgi:hypothetical protein
MSIGFVIGTGRCGTKSMTYVLNEQENVKAEHEMMKCHWEYNDIDIQRNVRHLLGLVKYNDDIDLAVAAAFYFLPYSEMLIEKYNAKIVCLKRAKEEVVDSYLRKWKNKNQFSPNNPAVTTSDYKYYIRNYWHFTYPTFKNKDVREATSQYWDLYYEMSSEFQLRFPSNFRVFDMHSVLNTEKGQVGALEFMGVGATKLLLNIRLNKLIQKLRKIRWSERGGYIHCGKVYL